MWMGFAILVGTFGPHNVI